MPKVTIIDQDNIRWQISLLRYALAVSDKSLVMYTIGTMLVGGMLTLFALMIVFGTST